MKLSITRNYLITVTLGLIISTSVFGQIFGKPQIIRLECIVTGQTSSDKHETKHPKSKIFVTIENRDVRVDGDTNYTFTFFELPPNIKTENLSDSQKYRFKKTERGTLKVDEDLTIDRVTGYINYKQIYYQTKWGQIERTITGECNPVKNTNKF
jgi:hypothetical protein